MSETIEKIQSLLTKLGYTNNEDWRDNVDVNETLDSVLSTLERLQERLK